MAAAYLDPNLNHTPNSNAKSRLSTGMERSPGTIERVLKVFHYFETNSEPATWASNIRHGDATDVRVSASRRTVSLFTAKAAFRILITPFLPVLGPTWVAPGIITLLH